MKLEREIEWLKGVVRELVTTVKRLEAENRSFRAQIDQTSRNSSRPPSTDLPAMTKPERKPSGRKPGGQPGHPGKTRPLVAAMYTFVRLEGAPPTINNAERIVRHPVLWPKRSFGTWSESGSRYLERILTVVATLRIQKRNVLAHLTEASRNAVLHQAAPSLISAAITAPSLAA